METEGTEENKKVVLGASVNMTMATTEEETPGGEGGGTETIEVTQTQTTRVTEEHGVSSPSASQPPLTSPSTNGTLETGGESTTIGRWSSYSVTDSSSCSASIFVTAECIASAEMLTPVRFFLFVVVT